MYIRVANGTISLTFFIALAPDVWVSVPPPPIPTGDRPSSPPRIDASQFVLLALDLKLEFSITCLVIFIIVNLALNLELNITCFVNLLKIVNLDLSLELSITCFCHFFLKNKLL